MHNNCHKEGHLHIDIFEMQRSSAAAVSAMQEVAWRSGVSPTHPTLVPGTLLKDGKSRCWKPWNM